MEPVQKPRKVYNYPFWFGGASSMWAATFTHPLDLVKVRLQTAPKVGSVEKKGMVETMGKIVKTEGFRGLYSGLTASLLRQATYSTTRFGVYEYLKARVRSKASSSSASNTSKQSSDEIGFGTLVAMASVSGFLGSAVGNPADIINVRMQRDLALPPAKRYNYSNAIHGLITMTRTEGVSSLFRGMLPNTGRGALMTASQLASYDEFKRLLLASGWFVDGLVTHFTASTLAGGVATLICSPVDVIKTKIMSASGEEGILKVLRDTTRKEGLGWMFRGVVPSFIRLGPHTILTFVFLEQHKKLWRMAKDEAII